MAVRRRPAGVDARGCDVVGDRLRQGFDWLFRDRRTGRVVVAQAPNLPLWLFLGASVLRRLLDPGRPASTILTVVATGSLLWWAADEVLRGVNPFRRMLGAAVGGFTLAVLAWR